MRRLSVSSVTSLSGYFGEGSVSVMRMRVVIMSASVSRQVLLFGPDETEQKEDE